MVMVLAAMVAMVLVAMVLLVGDSDLVIQPFMVGWVTLSEWLACMVDFLVGMDMGVMAMVKSMAAMVEEKAMVAVMVVEKDMARAAKTTATRDMATVGTDVPLEVLRPTTHPLLLLITLPTIINQCLVMVLIKPTSHLRVTNLSDSVLHISTLLVDSTHPDNVTERCTMANSRI